MGRFTEWLFGLSTWQRVLTAFILYLGGIPWLIIGISVSIFEENAPFISLEELNLQGESSYLTTGLVFIFAGILYLAGAIYATYRYVYEKQNRSAEFHRPLIQDRKAFLKIQPFFCENCKKFSDTLREYCEYCGIENSVRRATKRDFKLYMKSDQMMNKDQLKEDNAPLEVRNNTSESRIIFPASALKVKSSKDIATFLKEYPYFCVKCKNFAKDAVPKSPQKQNYFYYSTFCGICGASDSIRIATKKDVKQFLLKTRKNK